ncbi:MAG: ABC transporter permease [Xanthomonadales bacterium]|nr:ABC transporter permease [Xanthomonadales bacterium]ODU93395.1 MAG: ABC transporter permease [Rhodanobacter sp. SCN 66-43]OJY83153.1 MAG: ABC transporter permease [Xanthomonadales bacterium 66-474]
MEIRPIISTLRRHKLTATLLTLQVAFTCAIVCNVAFMIANRVQQVSLPSGLDENVLSVIHSTGIGPDAETNPWAQHEADLAALRAIPGVESVVAVSYALPLNRNEWSSGTCPDKQALDRAMQVMSMHGTGCIDSSIYNGSPGLIPTLGLNLVVGRNFLPDEYVLGQKTPPVAIISQALAHRFYPGQDPLGKEMYNGAKSPIRVIGVVKTLLRPNLHGTGTNYDSIIWPQKPNSPGSDYVMRSAPQNRERILKAAKAALLKVNPSRIINPKYTQTYTQIRAEYFQRDTTMIGLLIASALGLLFVTALGITGLANFWVGQRTRSIGIRRAIGATRGDILRYFQTENFLIVTFGVVLGVLLSIGLNLLLMQHYELPRLPLWYLPVGAGMLWLLGQLAVLAPALRASRVPPVVATRSV